MESNSILELSPKVFEFEKNVPKLKPQGVKIGEIGLKPTLGEPPNKFKVPSLGLKVVLKRKKPHKIHIHLFLWHFHLTSYHNKNTYLSLKRNIVVFHLEVPKVQCYFKCI
jgi:hypothetical protein